jgi:hypothetical protein
LTFRDLSDIKRTQTFCHVIFSGNTRNAKEEVNRARDEAEKGPTTHAHLLDAWWGPSQASCVILMQLGLHGLGLTQKQTIYTPSNDFAMGKQKNTKYTIWI